MNADLVSDQCLSRETLAAAFASYSGSGGGAEGNPVEAHEIQSETEPSTVMEGHADGAVGDTPLLEERIAIKYRERYTSEKVRS